MKAMMFNRLGDTEVMELVERPDPVPGPGEVLVEITAAGVNFMDIGVRQGMAWNEMPWPRPLGVEGAGKVAALGEGVTGLSQGQRVAWVYAPGSYADRIVLPAAALVPVPDAIDDHVAAAIMMQGLTASHFATDFYPVQAGDIALVHAAAGGVGQLLSHIIRMRGGHVIGRVSNAAKVEAARQAGAQHVIIASDGDFAEEVIRLSGGEGVHVVYDGSGPATFKGSLASLRRGGTLCWYGPVLGAAQTVGLMELPRSIKIGYAVFMDHIPTPQALRARAADLFGWLESGDLKVDIGGLYPLAEAARAHDDMAARRTTGKLLLIP